MGPILPTSDNYPVTGCDHDGTKAGGTGVAIEGTRLPKRQCQTSPGQTASGSDNGPLSSINNINTSAGIPTRPMYGLSPVFIVVELSERREAQRSGNRRRDQRRKHQPQSRLHCQ